MSGTDKEMGGSQKEDEKYRDCKGEGWGDINTD